MDQERFDDITKALANGSDRRSVMKRLAGGMLGGVAALSIVGADAKRKKNRNKCAKEGASCTTKSCCSGLTCDATSSTCVAPTPPPPPPVTCAVGTKCNPKVKTSCGDPNTCECLGIVDDILRATFHYECRTVETCRPTYHSCTVGAPKESRFDCCSEGDYCKPVIGKKGFCKPKPTCPVHNQCEYEGQSCAENEEDKGCFCRKFKHEWLCVFDPKYGKGDGPTS
jgi:hypothetical protein